jgi:hypothetical protein
MLLSEVVTYGELDLKADRMAPMYHYTVRQPLLRMMIGLLSGAAAPARQ